jgi:hypothetical protein
VRRKIPLALLSEECAKPSVAEENKHNDQKAVKDDTRAPFGRAENLVRILTQQVSQILK